MFSFNFLFYKNNIAKILLLYRNNNPIQDQAIEVDYNTEKSDDQNSDENLNNFLDDYYSEMDADEIKGKSDIQTNDYRE